MDRRRWVPSTPVVTLLLLFMLFAPAPRLPSRNGESSEKSIKAEKRAFSEIKNATFLNIPERVEHSLTFPTEIWETRDGLFEEPVGKGDSHLNHTSVMTGNWNILPYPSFGKVSPNVTWHTTLRNIVMSQSGRFSANLYEYVDGNSDGISFVLNLENNNDTSVYHMTFHGDRVKPINVFLGSTDVTPNFGGVDVIPWLLKDSPYKDAPPLDGTEYFPLLQNRSLERIETRLQDAQTVGWSPLVFEEEEVTCSAFVFLHNKNTGLDKETLKAIENEFYHPQGVSTQKMPEVFVSGLVYSPDCNVAFTFSNTKGPRNFVLENHLVRFSSLYIFIVLSQIFVLLRQMRINSPSHVQRLSFLTIAMQAGLDAYIAIFFLSTNAVIEKGYLPFVSVAFLSLVPSVMFTMRYLALILRVQNSNMPPPAPRPVTNNSSNNNTNQSNASNENSPNAPSAANDNTETTTVNPPQEDDQPMTQHERDQRDWSAVCLRFYFIILVVCIASLYSAFWPVIYRFYFISALIFTSYSFWIPQIIQNVKQGTSRSFTWTYILGASVLRLYLPLAIFIDSELILGFPPKYFFALGLVLWMLFQVLVLLVQDTLGPRFFLPKKVSQHFLNRAFEALMFLKC